ncbi:MAG: DNA adenine methylase [Gammaproteobacteria bacterium]|nr:DNA adenine methylase [Gammaproteobacteria bacterium]
MATLASPLRYPGGKAAMAPLLRKVRSLNGLGQHSIAEPFAGGAGAALEMLMGEDTHYIVINDLDPSIGDFWWALTNQSTRFLRLIDDAPLNIEEWKRQRAILKKPWQYSRLRRGFATFYLNRCNRSGIILNGGPIGGYDQKGRWKIDARFNRKRLRERCSRIIEYRDRIQLSNLDGIQLVEDHADDKTFLFIDPPYYNKGPKLYLNALDHEYHKRLAGILGSKQDASWVVTYDDCPEIRALYENWAQVISFGLRYSASGAAQGKEVCIAPQWLQLPDDLESRRISWIKNHGA